MQVSQTWRDEKGLLHRDNDQPAVVHPDGAKAWFRHGKLHRDVGPAYIDPTTGAQQWWIDGKCVGEDEPLQCAKLTR